MRRLITTLAATLAALAAGTGTAIAANPVESSTQSSSTDQAARTRMVKSCKCQ